MCAGASPTELLDDRRLRKRRGGGGCALEKSTAHDDAKHKSTNTADALKQCASKEYSSEHKMAQKHKYSGRAQIQIVR